MALTKITGEGYGVGTITTDDNTATLTLKSTDADGSVGPVLDLVRDSASPADGDAVGIIKFLADNDAGESTIYSQAFTTLRDASNGAEDGQTINYVMTNGALVDHLRMGRGSAGGQSEVVINEGGVDVDFRVESNSNTNAFFVNGASGKCSMGSSGEQGGSNVATLDLSAAGNAALGVGRHDNDLGSCVRFFKINSSNSGTIVGSINVASSSTAYNTSSDYRLKTSVSYDWDATTRLKNLKPARFKWIADGESAEFVDGFLAHEAATVVPEAVSGDKDAVDADGNINPQGMDYSKVVPLLVKTIQELEARIVALETA